MKIAFTGHRPDKLGGYDDARNLKADVQAVLRDWLDANGPVERAFNGLALGFDQWAFEVCLEKAIDVVACVPCPGQPNAWPESSRRRYEYLIERANEVHLISHTFSRTAFQRRNEWMVDALEKGDALVELWNGGESGGAYNCHRYAVSKAPLRGFSIVNLWGSVEAKKGV